MSISQEQKLGILTKFAKKFADMNNVTVPTLAGIYYASDGSAYVTNGKYALRIRDIHSNHQPFISHVTLGHRLYGNYPKMEEAFPDPSEFTHELTLFEGGERKEISTATKLIKVADDITKAIKVDRICNLIVKNGELKITISQHNVNYSAPIAVTNEPFEYLNSFNSEYLFNAMDVFRYARTQVLRIQFINGPKPIIMRDQTNGIDVLIMPYGKPRW